MRSLSRASAVFVVVLVIFGVVGFAGKSLLHLDCVGPYLAGWGCLAQPIPTSLDDVAIWSGNALHYVAAAIVLFAACFILRDAVCYAAFFIARRFFPGWVDRGKQEAQPPRGYRYR
jgi:hypothetical protein